MQVKSAGRIGVYGASGSGKSTRVKVLLADRTRAIVFDPMDEYRGAGRFARAETLGQVLALLKRHWRRGFRIAYVPPAGREPLALHRLAQLVIQAQAPYRLGRDPRILTLAVEELNLSFPVTALGAELTGMPELCSRGRHSGVELIGVTQRVSEVSTRFRGNTTEAYYFRPGDHRDLTTACQMLGPECRGRLKDLHTHEYLHLAGGRITSGRNALKKPRRA